jgi:hypothetical protein
MKKILGISLIVATLLWCVSPAMAWGPRLSVDEETWIEFGFLAQMQFESIEDAAGVNNNEWSSEFFTRRARIMAQGSVHEMVKFVFTTDVPNAGKTGSANTLVWNDGLIDLQFAPEINVSIGRILPPFSIETQSSAVTLLGIDYNVNVVKLPTFNDRSFWRDDGIEARGIVAEGLVDYRFGTFRGERSTILNPDHDGRFTGMIMVNLEDPQPGWYYNTNSLGAFNMLSVGVGYDRIGNSHASTGKAWSVFALMDQEMGMGRLTGSAAWYDWDGPNWAGGFEGTTSAIQVGYLMPTEFLPGAWQPVVRFQRQNPDVGSTLNTVNFGVNYYLKGHNINFKADYAFNDQRINGSKKDAIRFQTQLFF